MRVRTLMSIIGAWTVVAAPVSAQSETRPALTLENLETINATAVATRHEGRNAILLTERRPADSTRAAGHSLAIVKGVQFGEGTIEIDVAGRPSANADTTVRGFVGIAFHATDGTRQFKTFYLRATNARSTDQVRRNHSVQYTSEPAYPWFRLRREFSKVYETYVDIEPGKWTRMRIEFRDGKALLFVHDAKEPTLVINDLKSDVRSGGIGLWVGGGTDAWFSNLRVRTGR